MAKWKIHQLSYIADKLVQPGEEITLPPTQVPGPHWEPLDEEAKAVAANGGVAFTGEMPDVLSGLEPQFRAAMERAGVGTGQVQAMDKEALADAIAGALQRLMNVKPPEPEPVKPAAAKPAQTPSPALPLDGGDDGAASSQASAGKSAPAATPKK